MRFKPGTCALALVGILAAAGCAGSGQPPGSGPTVTRQPGPAQSGTIGSPPGPVPSPSAISGGAPGSTVTGRYLERVNMQAPPHPAGGGTVGLFPHAFQTGPNARAGSEAAGGEPVAVATIGPDGRFVMNGVPNGVWFLARSDGAAVTDGRWVRVTVEQGAATDLIGCRECPPRM